MSYDVYVFEPDEGAPDDRGEVFWANYTSNCGPMFELAIGQRLGKLHGAPCSEAAGPLASAIRRMEADPEPFRALNPPNGWGGYNGALLFLRDLAKAAAEHPGGWIEVQW